MRNRLLAARRLRRLPAQGRKAVASHARHVSPREPSRRMNSVTSGRRGGLAGFQDASSQGDEHMFQARFNKYTGLAVLCILASPMLAGSGCGGIFDFLLPPTIT